MLCTVEPTTNNICGALIGIGVSGYRLAEQIILVRIIFFDGKLVRQVPIRFKMTQVFIGKLEAKNYSFIIFYTISQGLIKGRIRLFEGDKLVATQNIPKHKKIRQSHTFKLTRTPSFKLLNNPLCRIKNFRLTDRSDWKNPVHLKLLPESGSSFELVFQTRFNNVKGKVLDKNKDIGILLIRESI